MNPQKLFIVVNVDWAFLLFRKDIAIAALNSGYDVSIITKDTGRRKEIESFGLQFIDFPFERSGSNPLHESKCIWSLFRLYTKNRPDIIHHVTLKAALLGSVAAKLAGFKNVVNAISGFGYNFTAGRDGIQQKIIKKLMKLAFKSKHFHYIFQNPDDISPFSQLKFVSEEKIHLIKGSGVDLNKFTFEKEIPKEKSTVYSPCPNVD
ncbi:hypothetical protein AGMMS49574_19070 [Bacteroidia bacterium]|nr:hypothetical protein AGMMS49574_19070 [Bacteroidia bacterium]